MADWSTADIPSQAGKLAIVTGANSGIGYYTALELARAGAQVIVACRNEAKGKATAAAINAVAPGMAVFETLDLASLASVRDFAARVKEAQGKLDILVNNAAVMGLPKRQVTADGFEMQLGVNFLGHFLLTALLLQRLMMASAPRVVQVSSIAHRQGHIDLKDLQALHGYKGMQVYNQTKLAMLMFALELQRRSDAGGWGILSLAAHPGISRTELVVNGFGPDSGMAFLMKLAGPFVTQSAERGAWPSLMAATSPQVAPSGYYGPTGFMEFRGPAGVAKPARQALDQTVAKALWEAAETLTGQKLTPDP
jgi:NAD(P)-dependent dehydrogenase (short-subunit alcohol dehydrogenase family)